MPVPVNVVDAGGLPITETDLGTPMTPVDAEDVQALPVTIVSSGGLPVVLVNDDLSPYEEEE